MNIKRCRYMKAWSGMCGCTDVLENGQCKDHQSKCFKCGKLATRGCEGMAGNFVCGMPLCDKCKHC